MILGVVNLNCSYYTCDQETLSKWSGSFETLDTAFMTPLLRSAVQFVFFEAWDALIVNGKSQQYASALKRCMVPPLSHSLKSGNVFKKKTTANQHPPRAPPIAFVLRKVCPSWLSHLPSLETATSACFQVPAPQAVIWGWNMWKTLPRVLPDPFPERRKRNQTSNSMFANQRKKTYTKQTWSPFSGLKEDAFACSSYIYIWYEMFVSNHGFGYMGMCKNKFTSQEMSHGSSKT